MHYIMYPQTNIEIIVIIGRKEEIIMKLKKNNFTAAGDCHRNVGICRFYNCSC